MSDEETASDLGAPPPEPPPQPKKARRWRRWLARLAIYGVLGLVGLLVLVLQFPADTVTQRVALPFARELLKHPGIEVGAVDFYALDGLVLHDLRVGPPKGYQRDVFTAKRVVVRYDVTDAPSRIVVRDILLDEPAAFLEIVDGKPNVLALLEALPPSEPKPETPPSDPFDLTVRIQNVGVRGLTVGFDDGARTARFGLLSAWISGEINPAKGGRIGVELRVGDTAPDRPNLEVGAEQGAGAIELRTRVSIAAEVGPAFADPKASLSLRHRMRVAPVTKPLPLPGAELRAALDAKADLGAKTAEITQLAAWLGDAQVLDLAAQVTDLDSPRFALQLRHAGVALPELLPFARALLPPEVKLDLQGAVGLRDLNVSGDAASLQKGALPELVATLFAEGLGVHVDTGGGVEKAGPLALTLPPLIADLKGARAALDLRAGAGLAAVSVKGTLGLDEVAVIGARVAGLDVELDTRAELNAPDDPRSVATDVKVRLREVAGFGAAVGDLAVGLEVRAELTDKLPTAADAKVAIDVGNVQGFGVRADGIETRIATRVEFAGDRPKRASVDLTADIPRVRSEVPGVGLVQLGGLHAEVVADADPAAKDVHLKKLVARVGRLLSARMSATIRNEGHDELSVDAAVDRLDLGKLLRSAPRAIRRKLPAGLVAGGHLGATLSVRGKRPSEKLVAQASRNPVAALRLPLAVRADLRMNGVRARLRSAGLDVRGLGGHVRLQTGYGKVSVTSPQPIHLARVAAAGATLEGLELPFELKVTGNGVAASGGLRAKQFGARQKDLDARGQGLFANLSARLDATLWKVLAKRKFDVRDAELELSGGFEKLRARQGDLQATLGGVDQRVSVRARLGEPLAVRLTHRVGSVALPGKKLEVRDLDFHHEIDVEGLRLAGISLRRPIPDARPTRVRHHGGLRPIDGRTLRIHAPGVPGDGWLTGNELTFDLEVSVPQLRLPPVDKDLFAEVEVIRLHAFELRNRSHGPVVSARGTIGPLVYPSTAVPPFDLQGRAGFAMPEGGLEVFRLGSEAAHDLQAARIDGEAWGSARLQHAKDGPLDVRLMLHAKDLDIRLEQHGHQETLPNGTQVFLARTITVDDFDADFPVRQRLNLEKARALATDKQALAAALANVEHLWPAARQVRRRSRSPAYEALRFAAAPPNVTADRVDVNQRFTYFRQGEQIDAVDVPLSLERLALDVGYEDWVFDVRRFYVHTLDGDVEARLAAQVKAAQPPDADLALKLGVTGVDISLLDPRKKGEKAPITFVAESDVNLLDRVVDGVVHVSKLSLAQLDALFAFVDPARRNDLIQEQRKLINSYTVRQWAAPTVKYVHLDIQHSSLDLETAFGGAWGVRHVLNKVVSSLKVENIDLREIIDNVLSDRQARFAWRTPPPLGEAPDAEETP